MEGKGIVSNGHAQTGAHLKRSYKGHYMELGRKAEEIVMAWLRAAPDVVSVEDLRGVKAMQDADIDCQFTLRNGTVNLAEIKYDSYLGVTGNVLFEVARINHYSPPARCCTLGWTARTPALYLFYYAPEMHSIYKCVFDDFRRSFQKYTAEARDKVNLTYVETDEGKKTVNILVPWKYCEAIFQVIPLETK